MFNPKDLYKILVKNQKYLEDENQKARDKALKYAKKILICPYHSILYIDKKVPHSDFKMESMASMFPNCPICNPNGNVKTNTQQTQNTSYTAKPKQETKQAEATTKPHATPKPNTKPSQAEKQPEKVNNVCSFCPTDEEIEQENNKIQKNKQFYLQKLELKKIEWQNKALDFEIYKQEVKNRGVLPNCPYARANLTCKDINSAFTIINWICKTTHLPCKITLKCDLDNNLSLSLLKHYAERSGRNKSIYEIGIANTLKSLINKKNAFKKNTGDSLQERLLKKDIIHGKVYFERPYDMKREIAFAIGGATIRGIFDGNIKRVKDCKQSLDCQKKKYLVQGNIHYYFRDEFTDPYDIFNFFPGKIDIDGVPFAITGEFNVSINSMYYANGVEVTRGY